MLFSNILGDRFHILHIRCYFQWLQQGSLGLFLATTPPFPPPHDPAVHSSDVLSQC